MVRVKQRNVARAAKPNSRADPGPSKPAPASKGGRKNFPEPPSDDSEVEELALSGNQHDSDEEVHQIPAPRTRSSKLGSHGESSLSNGKGKQPAKGKGKARAAPSKASRKTVPAADDMEVDQIEIVDEDEESGPGPIIATAINSVANGRRANVTARSAKAVDTSGLEEQLRQVRSLVSRLRTSHSFKQNITGGSPGSDPVAATTGSVSDTGDGSRTIAQTARGSVRGPIARFVSTSEVSLTPCLHFN